MEFKIREAREAANLSQRELAKLLGIAPATLHGYETGKHDPKSDLLVQIARFCRTSVDFLLGFADGNEKDPPTPQSARQKDLVTKEEVEAVLIGLGITKPGEHITDADLDFLSSVVVLIQAWFNNKGKQG